MVRVVYFIRSTKNQGIVPVRLRLTDGRRADIFHKTDIKALLEDLAKFTPECQLKPRVSVYNRDLLDHLQAEVRLMKSAYEQMLEKGLDMTGAVLEALIEEAKHPVQAIRKDEEPLVERFRRHVQEAKQDGIIGDKRARHILVVADKLERFLIIKGLTHITAKEFDEKLLMDFRQFLFDEYLFVPKNKKLYKDVLPQNTPKSRLSTNTVVSQLKMLHALFSELEDIDEIDKSPFRKLNKERKKTVMKTKFDEPFFLRKEEFKTILNNRIPNCLTAVRDAFLVQCAFGCRIGDFQHLTIDNVSVSEDGIPYIHYLPHKTQDEQTDNSEIKTPIVRFAFDIIKRTNLNFPIVRNIYGKTGYNALIKSLLKSCDINRKVPIYDESHKGNVYLPLNQLGSSKLARKTHVDMITKVQLDMYASGLHKKGSNAVHRYTELELKDRFQLLNYAFDQHPFKVDEELNIIEQ